MKNVFPFYFLKFNFSFAQTNPFQNIDDDTSVVSATFYCASRKKPHIFETGIQTIFYCDQIWLFCLLTDEVGS